MDYKDKFAQSRSIVANHFTFYGGVMIGADTKNGEREKIETMATDGKKIFWSKDFVVKNTEIENATVVIHEVCHITDKHHLRMGNKDAKLWNIACDLSINNRIDGLTSFKNPKIRLQLPKGGYLDIPEYGLTRDFCKKASADEIYGVLIANKDTAKDLPQQSWGGKVEQPKNEDGTPMNAQQLEQASKSIDRKITQAGMKAKAVGDVPKDVQEILKRVEEPKVEWQDAFTFAWQGGDNDYTYTYRKINKKHLLWDVVDPTITGLNCGDVGVLQDTSASVNKKQRDRGFSEMNALSKDVQPESITIIPFTSRVDTSGIKRFEKGEEVASLNINGSGGTAIQPAFRHVDQNWHDYNFKKLVIFTDCEINDYGQEPQFDEPCDIIWVCCQSKEKLTKYFPEPPYGQVIYIDE
jgi:predicted metal-dependent peptidase